MQRLKELYLLQRVPYFTDLPGIRCCCHTTFFDSKFGPWTKSQAGLVLPGTVEDTFFAEHIPESGAVLKLPLP